MAEPVPPSVVPQPLPLEYTAVPPQKPSDPLAFTAAACSLMGLVFLPLAPVGLVMGLWALATLRRRTPVGRAMAIVAVVAGVIGSGGLVAVIVWVGHMQPAMAAGGR